MWFWVEKICRRLKEVRKILREINIRLRCYEITTMNLVAAFNWNTEEYAKNATNMNI